MGNLNNHNINCKQWPNWLAGQRNFPHPHTSSLEVSLYSGDGLSVGECKRGGGGGGKRAKSAAPPPMLTNDGRIFKIFQRSEPSSSSQTWATTTTFARSATYAAQRVEGSRSNHTSIFPIHHEKAADRLPPHRVTCEVARKSKLDQ